MTDARSLPEPVALAARAPWAETVEPRAWAEGVARLDIDNPPADVPAKRWVQFIDDAGRFLDRGWAAKAAALGWGPLDLFGCDPMKPFARIERAGLLWLLCGNRLVALSANQAVIELGKGVRQTYYRTASRKRGAVLAWELNSTLKGDVT